MTLLWTLSFLLQLLIPGLLAVPTDGSGADSNHCENHQDGYSGAGFQCNVTKSDTFFVGSQLISSYAGTLLSEFSAWSVIEGNQLKGLPEECAGHGLSVSAANQLQHKVNVYISHQSWPQKKVSKKMAGQKTSKNAVKKSHGHHAATQVALPDAKICAFAAYPNPTKENPKPDPVLCH